MKKLTLLLLALLYVTLTYAYTERDLLQKQADINRLKEILVLDRQWVTYPDYNDRAGWDRFLGTFKDEYIRRGEKRLNYQWQVVKATDYLAFERTGNRQDDPRLPASRTGRLQRRLHSVPGRERMARHLQLLPEG